MKKAIEHQIGTMQVRQYFDQESKSWITMVCDAEGLQVGEVGYCDYGDKESRRRHMNACKKRARDLQGISRWKDANTAATS